jgi:hypothetical protein
VKEGVGQFTFGVQLLVTFSCCLLVGCFSDWSARP